MNNPNDDEFLLFVLLFVGGILLVWLVLAIFFLLTLHKALARCRPRNRTMEPGMVWLNLIPVFYLAWQFVTVLRVAESLRNEFRDRGWHRRGDNYSQGVGITTCIMLILSCIPYCGAIFLLVWLICFIIYWVQIAGYSSQLASGEFSADDRDEDYDNDDDDDDRPRRSRDRREDDDDDDRPRRSPR
jgi:hypothetical protein